MQSVAVLVHGVAGLIRDVRTYQDVVFPERGLRGEADAIPIEPDLAYAGRRDSPARPRDADVGDGWRRDPLGEPDVD